MPETEEEAIDYNNALIERIKNLRWVGFNGLWLIIIATLIMFKTKTEAEVYSLLFMFYIFIITLIVFCFCNKKFFVEIYDFHTRSVLVSDSKKKSKVSMITFVYQSQNELLSFISQFILCWNGVFLLCTSGILHKINLIYVVVIFIISAIMMDITNNKYNS